MEHNNYSKAKALLEKYHAGECTKEELALLEEWYQSLSEESPGVLTEAGKDFYKEQFFADFRNRLPVQKRGWISRPFIRWAAAACIIMLAGSGYMLINRASLPDTQLATNKIHEVSNETNHVRKLILTDSSVVWLNAHASLSWKDDFTQGTRNVELTGEGFFDVHKDSNRPFVIHTRDMAIHVLGTAFNVEAYKNEKMTRVSLVRGIVQVRSNKDSSLQAPLQPGYAATFSDGADSIEVEQTNIDMTGAWKEGGFAVKDISIYDAVRRLCERNGYSVQWVNAKSSRKIISVVFKKENFEEIMSNLCYMIHKEYKITGKQVSIY